MNKLGAEKNEFVQMGFLFPQNRMELKNNNNLVMT